MGNEASKCEWRHAPEARGEFWEILKMSLSRVQTRHRTRRLTFPCSQRPWAGVARDGGADEKARIERLCLSPYVEKPLNSKVIKSFVPELRSRKCFSCFEIPMFYVIYIYEHYMSISHITISWLWYNKTTNYNWHNRHFHRRCPWCNGYRHRNWTRRHEFKWWTDCISHSTNTLGKGMNPIILPPAMGK